MTLIKKHLNLHSLLILPMVLALLYPTSSIAKQRDADYYYNKIFNTHPAGFIVTAPNKKTLRNYNSGSGSIPASTIKVLTAYMALEHWGKDHRFHTDFMLDSQYFLRVKGYGDPYLVSEEMKKIAEELSVRLKIRNITNLKGIIIDDSYYNSNLSQTNTHRSLNPYDAPLNAVSVNFNSIGFYKSKGNIYPIEDQTPITPMAYELSPLVGNGKRRISLRHPYQATEYFKQILTVMLEKENIAVGNQPYRYIPKDLPIFYRHYNSNSLESIVKKMLRYSNNFIANQLFLSLGVEGSIFKLFGSMDRSQSYTRFFVEKKLNWDNYNVADGAGLSRKTFVSPRQMIDLLYKFEKYAYLLPCTKDGKICGKTGTLSNVHSYIGYFNHNGYQYPFAIMINKKMPYRFRKKAARAIYNDIFNY
jgi:serine-type D-Ala-D-Ala carboxypeptidase/endopeptidase (penicillin-binding protein 4)